MRAPDDPALRPTGDLMLDERTVDHLLDGLLGPEDVPAEYLAVVGLLRALSLPPSPAELSMQTVAVEATLTELALRPVPRGSKAPIPASGRRWSERSRFFRVKVASLVLVGTLIGTAGLAAAGALPVPLQNVASKVLAKVGISVPTSHAHPSSSGEEISKTATTIDATGIDKGQEISAAASDGHSQAGEHGKPSPPAHPGHPGQPAPSGVTGSPMMRMACRTHLGTRTRAARRTTPRPRPKITGSRALRPSVSSASELLAPSMAGLFPEPSTPRVRVCGTRSRAKSPFPNPTESVTIA